ncbi:MAG: hypothetical protein M0Z30_02015 [Actinomycetota bacterium]|nr:hypothetical protein [Actinomycetota bacterium]
MIGYSRSAEQVLTVLLIEAGVDLSESPDGDWWGSNALVASEGDRRLYGKED